MDSEGKAIPNKFGWKEKLKERTCLQDINPDGTILSILIGQTLESETSIPNKSSKNDFTIFRSVWNRWDYESLDPEFNSAVIYSRINKQNESQQYEVYDEGVIYLPESFSGGLRLVRHADGESWWLIVPLTTPGSFLSVHISPDGLPMVQHLSVSDYPYSTFLLGEPKRPTYALKFNISGDGKKLAALDVTRGNIAMYEIDRCTGHIYNPKKVYEFMVFDSTGHYFPLSFADLVFSPNSRYLYAGMWKEELQFDTEADDIEATKYVVAKEYFYPITFDTTGIKVPEHAFMPNINFYEQQLTPDGRIIVIGANDHGTNKWYAVIEDPDQGGAACNINLFGFDSHYAPLGDMCANNIPNFDLGPLPAGSCKTGTETPDITVKNFDGSLYIDIGNIPLGVKKACLKLYDILGCLLYYDCVDIIPNQDYSKEIAILDKYLSPACYVAAVEFDTGGFVSKKVMVLK